MNVRETKFALIQLKAAVNNVMIVLCRKMERHVNELVFHRSVPNPKMIIATSTMSGTIRVYVVQQMTDAISRRQMENVM